MRSAVDRLAEVARLLEGHRDVLAGRVEGPTPPAWCASRRWVDPLLALDDATLAAAERAPARTLAAHDGLPADLRALARAATRCTELPPLAPAASEVIRGAGPSKRAQVAALRERLLAAETTAARVVDYGAGRGHLTRALAAALDRPAVGLERRRDVAASARAMSDGCQVRFIDADVRSGELTIGASDLLVGLHACGALGDTLVEDAVRAGACALLVPCCPQKIPGATRAPRSAEGRRRGLSFARELLGLANLGALGAGPISLEDAATRRRGRYALRILLAAAGHPSAPGEESRGINRKRFRRPLREVADAAFAARGLAAPSPRAVADAERRALEEHAAMRRLALPRRALARPLELALALDRAAALEEAGRSVEVVEAFARSVSPRNVAIVALRR